MGAPPNSRCMFTGKDFAIVAVESFGVGGTAPQAVGVALGAATSRSELVRALDVVAATLKSSAARTRVV